jgi:hypothetical protein
MEFTCSNSQGGKFVIKHFGNHVTALRSVFPELNLKPQKFYQYKGRFDQLFASLIVSFLQIQRIGEKLQMNLQNPSISALQMQRSGIPSRRKT